MIAGKAEEKGLELKTSLPAKVSQVKGDPNRLRQVLLNLVGNAIKFTEKGFVNVKIHFTQEENMLKVFVTDTGIGNDDIQLTPLIDDFLNGILVMMCWRARP